MDEYEGWVIVRHILNNASWINKLKSIDERSRYSKLDGIIVAACREKKVKLTEHDKSEVRFQVHKALKEGAA